MNMTDELIDRGFIETEEGTYKNRCNDTENTEEYQCEDNIEPKHYRKGAIDLYDSWYQTRPFSEFRAIMESVAERYMKRVKLDRVEDLDKAIYTLERLKEYEIKEGQDE